MTRKFLEAMFHSLLQEMKICAVVLDEMMNQENDELRKMMTYHRGTVYGKDVNNPDELSGTILGIMVHSLH